MMVLVVGATGMTGRALVEQLLSKGHTVRAIVRSPGKLPARVRDHPNATVIEASVLDLTDAEMAERVKECDAVVSCLGHVMDFKGMFGDPSPHYSRVTELLVVQAFSSVMTQMDAGVMTIEAMRRPVG